MEFYGSKNTWKDYDTFSANNFYIYIYIVWCLKWSWLCMYWWHAGNGTEGREWVVETASHGG